VSKQADARADKAERKVTDLTDRLDNWENYGSP
jgi:hypothetical protein